MKKFREIFIILLVLIIPLLHEVGHFIGYRIDNVSAKISYGLVIAESQTILGVLGGLVFNIFLALICLALVYISNKNKEIWSLIGLTSIVSRLVVCGMIFLLGIFIDYRILEQNDEGLLARLLGIPIYFQYIIFLALYIGLAFFIKKATKKDDVHKNDVFKIVGYNVVLAIILMF